MNAYVKSYDQYNRLTVREFSSRDRLSPLDDARREYQSVIASSALYAKLWVTDGREYITLGEYRRPA